MHRNDLPNFARWASDTSLCSEMRFRLIPFPTHEAGATHKMQRNCEFSSFQKYPDELVIRKCAWIRPFFFLPENVQSANSRKGYRKRAKSSASSRCRLQKTHRHAHPQANRVPKINLSPQSNTTMKLNQHQYQHRHQRPNRELRTYFYHSIAHASHRPTAHSRTHVTVF